MPPPPPDDEHPHRSSRRRRRRRHSSGDDDDDDDENYYDAYSRRSAGRSKKRDGRRRTNERSRRGRRRRRSSGESSSESGSSDEYSSDSSDDSSSGRDKRRRKGKQSKKKDKHKKEGSDSGSSSYDSSDDSSYDSSSYGSSYDSDDSSSESSSSSSSTFSITSESSEVSEASEVSSVATDDISDVDSQLQGEERLKAIQKKKQERKEDKAAEKQLKKYQERKKGREEKREKNRKKREEKVEKKKEGKEKRRQEKEERRDGKRDRGKRKHGKKEEGSSSEEETDDLDDGKSRKKDRKSRRDKTRERPVSAVSTVGTVQSDEISMIDSAISDRERKRLKALKKERLKQKKTEKKQQAKNEEREKERKQKKKEKEKKRIKREIERELDRMSSASTVSSVHSSELSLNEEDKYLDEETRKKKKASLKKKLSKAKQKSKNMMKAVAKVMEKRQREGRDDPLSSDDRRSTKGVSFADLAGGKEFKSTVDYAKGSKRGLTDKIEKTDGRGMDWMTEWQLLKEKQKRKEEMKLKKAAEKADEDPLDAYREIIKAERDARMSKVSKLKLFINRNLDILKGGTVRVKNDGTIADDDDSDAETIEIDDEGNMLTVPTSLRCDDADLKEWITDMDMSRGTTPVVPSDDENDPAGVRRVLKAFRKKPHEMTAHLQRVLETASELKADDLNRSTLRSQSARAVDERETTIDYMNHFRLVEKSKLDPMARSFTVEDKERTCVLTLDAMREALNGVPSLSALKTKQLEYVLKVLDLDDHSRITFKMFAVIGAICERMTAMDAVGQALIDQSDLLDIQRKMDLYSSMFYCNVSSERDDNYVTVETLRIELKAGGLNRFQEDYIISKMNPSEYNTVSFLDYMAYIPLFLSMHDNIIDNPFDFAEKYNKPSTEAQRDMNPLGFPLKRSYHALHHSLVSRCMTSPARRTPQPSRTSTKLPNIISKMSGFKIRPQPPKSASKIQKP
ncbi:glutamic acid-rich protein-like [Lytechinus pictus]|uniref:glutamic acid-rich protein-like n=2 Tax=Lytechinus TaxID=7652 RepID=UPI0030BA0CC1